MAFYFWIGGGSSPTGSWDINDHWSFTDGGSPAGSYPDGTNDIAILPHSASEDILDMGGFSGTIGMLIVHSNIYSLDFSNAEGYNSISFNLGLFYGGGSGPVGAGLNGPCIFFGNGSSNSQQVNGDAYFIGSGCTNYGEVTGNAFFTNSSGTVNETYGDVDGLAVFTGGSWENKGTLAGPAVFHGSGAGTSRLHSGSVTGALLPLSEFTNTGTAGKYPLDVLGAGI